MATTRPAGHSYIIKRPRLTKLLDETEARIILLCAPAGYGKTTLAQEWVETRSEPVAWCSCSAEMVDQVAMGSALQNCLHRAGLWQESVEDSPTLMVGDYGAAAFGRALTDGLASRPGLLVLDDYQSASESPESEALLASFIAGSHLRFVVISRLRPAWHTGRLEVYGEVMLMGPDRLKFTDDEALVVLGSRELCEVEPFLAQARGWPAVIGLVARGEPGPHPSAEGVLPTELFEFLVEDLYDATSPGLRRTLFLLALGGDRNLEILEELVGDLQSDLVAACDHGFLSRSSDGVLELHPLMRAFLIARLRMLRKRDAEQLAFALATRFAEARQWDESLQILKLFPHSVLVAEILQEALPDLLTGGRVATVRKWLDLAKTGQSASPLMLVAEAELALREGDEARAQGVAEHAARVIGTGELAAQAHVIAARAAHLLGDEAASRHNSTLARALTSDGGSTRVAALWLEYLHSLETNEPARARELLAQMEDEGDRSATHVLRIRNARSFLAYEVDGDVRRASREAGLAFGLLAHVPDPMLRTNFINMAANLAVSEGNYMRALRLTEQLAEDATQNGLDFVVDHALSTRAAALIGLRKLGSARRILGELESRASSASTFVLGQITLRRATLRVAAGDLAGAEILLRSPSPTIYPASSHGHWMGMRALLFAARGSGQFARDAATEARRASSYIDARNLSDLADAITEIQMEPPQGRALTVQVVTRILNQGHLDALVFGCRAFPPLTRVLADVPALAQQMTVALTSSKDIDIGRAGGLEMPRELRRTEGLSPREREVYELLVEGRTNPQIAQTLFISESTTKVHVRHIFEKLGVHSRAAAAAATVNDLD